MRRAETATAPRTRSAPRAARRVTSTSSTTAPRGARGRRTARAPPPPSGGPSKTASTAPSRAVAHPAGHPAPRRLAPRAVAEEHSLDVARSRPRVGVPAHSLRCSDDATPSPPGASTPSMDACSTSCSAPRTTSAGCPPARSRARRSPRTSSSATTTRVRQHAEMVSVYEEDGVNVHFLEPDPAPALPGVRARLEHQRPATGPIVTQCAQYWRRGEYAPVIRFYQQQGIPIHEHGHRRLARGRRLHDRRAGRRRHRHRRGAHPGAGRAAGRAVARSTTAGRCASSASRPTSSTSTCSPACSARSSPPSASSRPRPASWRGSRRRASRSSPVTLAAALKLGVNGVCLGGDRVLSTAESKDLNERLRALGLTVYDPELSAVHARRRRRPLPDAGDPARARRPGLALDRHPQRAQRAVARPAQRSAVVERLLDVVERLRGQPLARAARSGSPAGTRPATRRPPARPPRAPAPPPGAPGTPRAASSPARPTAAAARTPPASGSRSSALSVLDRLAQRRDQPLARGRRVLPHPEHRHHHVLAGQLHVHVVLLAQQPRQLVAARARAAHVDAPAAAGRRRTRRAPRPAARRARRARAPRAPPRAWPPAPRSVSASSAAPVDRRGAPGAVERRAQQRVRAGRLDERHAAVDHVLVDQVAVARGAPSPTGSGCRRSCGCSRSPGRRPATARAPAARR